MNYLSLILSAYLAFSNLDPARPPVGEHEWQNYLSAHNKSYSDEESALRRLIYSHTKQQLVNDYTYSFRLGLNHLADWTDKERAMLRGVRVPQLAGDSPNTDAEQAFLDEILKDTSKPVPDNLDWRKEGRVTKVKNQGMCGSCWAFAAVGTLEGQETLRGASRMVELSEQNLVDCVKVDAGCGGGLMKDAFEYLAAGNGIESEQDYPYSGKDGKCKFSKDKRIFEDGGGAILPIGNEEILKQVVAKYGPVSVAINASLASFNFYKSGVYKPLECAGTRFDLDHGVLVVGYGTDPKHGDFWIVKNSWSTAWGENGYIRMARNNKNMCGIATMATIATF